MLNKLLGPVASNIHDSLTRATRNLPFAWMGYFAKVVFLTHENAERWAVFLFPANSVHNAEQGGRPFSF
jgi:hypothetical protein